MPLNVSVIKGLCFDVDGTLSDTDDLYAQVVSRMLPARFFRNRDAIARRFVMWAEAPGNALLGHADTLGLDDEMAAILNWLHRARKHSKRNFLLVPGVDEMLKLLHGNFPMAVVSARDEAGTMRFLEHFDLAKYFDVIVTGLSARYTKPYPDPVLLAASKMKLTPENCLMIGDTTVDIRAGRSAGAQTLGVLCGFGEEPELRKMGASEIISVTSGLTDLLK
jgi:HAD superfamily hydrolase (TIGR01509 family)